MIVPVAGHHVPCAADINIIGMRDKLEKLSGMRLLHELGGRPAYKQRRNLDAPRRRNQCLLYRVAIRSMCTRPFKEARIPMPAPASIR